MKLSDEMKERLKRIDDYMKEYSSEDVWDELNNFVPKVEVLEKELELLQEEKNGFRAILIAIRKEFDIIDKVCDIAGVHHFDQTKEVLNKIIKGLK